MINAIGPMHDREFRNMIISDLHARGHSAPLPNAAGPPASEEGLIESPRWMQPGRRLSKPPNTREALSRPAVAGGSRAAAAEAKRVEVKGAFVHPSNDPDVIAGQGTATLELFDDAGPFDTLFVCCGGGGGFESA